MRYLFFSLCVSFLLVSCNGTDENPETPPIEEVAHYCDCNELAFDLPYNNFYLTEPREGYTGLCETYYGNGNLSLSKNFEKGKVHGTFTTYYESGAIHETKEFDVSFQVGDHFIYAEDGTLLHHSIYKWGKQTEIVFPASDN